MAVVDEVVGIPELFHLEEPSVVFTKVSEDKYAGKIIITVIIRSGGNVSLPLGERRPARAERGVHVVAHPSLLRHELLGELESHEFSH